MYHIGTDVSTLVDNTKYLHSLSKLVQTEKNNMSFDPKTTYTYT